MINNKQQAFMFVGEENAGVSNMTSAKMEEANSDTCHCSDVDFECHQYTIGKIRLSSIRLSYQRHISYVNFL